MSILLALVGIDDVIVATDSRAMADDDTYSDSHQKVYQAGFRTVCATCGLVASDAISAICDRPDLQDRPREMLEAVRDEVGKLVARIDAVPAYLSTVFTAMAVRKSPTGEVDLFVLEFPIAEVGTSRLPAAPELTHYIAWRPFARAFFYAGSLSSDAERLALSFNPDPKDDGSAVDQVDAIVATAQRGEFGSEIGGSIDVVRLDSTGVKWLRRKQWPSIKYVRPAWFEPAQRVLRTCSWASLAFAILILVWGLFRISPAYVH